MAEALEVQIRADSASFNKGVNEAIAGMNRLVSETKKISGSTQQMASGFSKMGSTISAAFKGLAAGLVAGGVVAAVQQIGVALAQNAERAEGFRASIAALRGSADQGADAMRRVYTVALKLGATVGDVSDVFKRLTVALAPLGASNRDIERMTESLIKLGRIGGSNMADINGAVLQLAQAMGSGKLQGDELRSILERFPLLAQEIAKEMGVTTGALRKLGSDGKIGVNEIYSAVQNMADEVDKKFAKLPLTIEQATNNIRTALARAFDSPVIISAVQTIALAINQIPKAITSADIAVRQFMTGLRSFGNSMANAFEPVTRTLTKMTDGFSNLASVIGPALAPIKNILYVAFIGPLAAIISNWDSLVAYFTNKVPQMFYTMAGAAREGMAAVLSIFSDGFAKLVDIAGRAINAIIDALNFMGSKVNAAFNAFGSAIGIGSTDIIGKIAPIKLEFEGLNNTIVGMQVAAKDNFAKAGQYAQKYATDLRTIARTAAETASAAEAGTAKWEDYNKVLDKVAASAGDTSGKGGGGKGGGAAGGIKKAGDAAKKAGEDMESAKSQVEEFGQAMQSIAQSLGSGVVDALFSIADGSKSAKEAFSELAKSMLKQIANMIVQLLILKPLMGMFGGGFGLLGGGAGLLGRSAALTRDGGRLAVGDYSGFRAANYSGFSGISRSALTSSPGSMSPKFEQKVEIINNAGVNVRTENNEKMLKIFLDAAEEMVADRITRGGNRIDQSMQRAFGAKRLGY